MRLNSKHAALILAAALLTACGNSETTPAAKAPAKQAVQAAPEVKAEVVQKILTPMENGAKISKKCVVCHSFDEGGANKVGPNLWGIIGSKAAQRDGFNYSKAMSESGITWDEATLNAYLTKPRDYLPGNRMAFVGIKKEQDRADLIAYLKEKTSP